MIAEFPKETGGAERTFAIIKHTNVCGIAQRTSTKESWDAALAGDPESAFGGVLVCNGTIDKATAEAINEIFFEVLIAPAFDEDALAILKSKKEPDPFTVKTTSIGREQYKSVLNGVLIQGNDEGNYSRMERRRWKRNDSRRKRRPGICQSCLQAFKVKCHCLGKK